jgi:hypothetical protein
MFRKTWFFHDVMRPVYSRRILVKWWRAGRPSPPPHEVKLWSILYLADRINARNLVETGAYLGDTIRALRGRFDKILSIEIVPELAYPLQAEFAADKSIEIVIGDSGVEIKRLLPTLDGPSVFWLDAHYSGGPTAGDGYVPIFEEIEAIAAAGDCAHAIIVDDMKDFLGVDGYPTENQLKEKLRSLGYDVASFNNILHALRA